MSSTVIQSKTESHEEEKEEDECEEACALCILQAASLRSRTGTAWPPAPSLSPLGHFLRFTEWGNIRLPQFPPGLRSEAKQAVT